MLSNKSIKVGRLFGIDVGLDISWFIIAIYLTWMIAESAAQGAVGIDMSRGQAYAFGAVMVALLFGSVLLHEFGHALTAKIFGVRTQRIVLHLFGGVALIESEPRRPMHEFWITAAGPATSLALSIGFWICAAAAAPFPAAELLAVLFTWAAGINFMLAIFNCLPGFPMDGGRVLRAAIWAVTGDYLRATRIAARTGVAVGSMIFMWGVAGILLRIAGINIPVVSWGGFMHLLLGPFLIFLAKVSARQAEYTAAFGDLTVGDIMRPIRAVVPADALVSDVVADYFQRLQGDQFPVVDGPRLLGYISQEAVSSCPRRQWDWVKAQELAQPYDSALIFAPTMAALPAFQSLMRQNRACQAVFEGRRLTGYLFAGDIARIMHDRMGGAAH